MSDLPTREQASGILLVKDLMISNNSDAVAIISGYINGDLMSRAEWEATINYEAAIEFALSEVKKGLVYTETEYDAAMRNQVHGIVDAAVGEETP